MVTIPLESVGFRTGAVPSREMVVVIEEAALKKNRRADTSSNGLDLETVLSVQLWVRTLGEPQHSWLDLHVFDDCDHLIGSETLPLHHVRSAEDDGDIVGFEGSVYRGTGASPGSVWLAPDARKLQYRLYSEACGTVDSELTNSSEPPSRRKRAT